MQKTISVFMSLTIMGAFAASSAFANRMILRPNNIRADLASRVPLLKRAERSNLDQSSAMKLNEGLAAAIKFFETERQSLPIVLSSGDTVRIVAEFANPQFIRGPRNSVALVDASGEGGKIKKAFIFQGKATEAELIKFAIEVKTDMLLESEAVYEWKGHALQQYNVFAYTAVQP